MRRLAMLLAFDCDGPLVDDESLNFIRWAKKEYGVRSDESVYLRHGFPVFFKHPKQVTNEWYENYRASDAWCGDRVTAGAQQALQRLEGVRKGIVTARSPSLCHETKSFVKKEFGDGVITDWHFDIAQKAEVVGSNGCLGYVEDSIDQARAVAQLGTVRTYLFPRRAILRENPVGQFVFLEAERMNREELGDKDWSQVCECAWEQIVDDMFVHLL